MQDDNIVVLDNIYKIYRMEGVEITALNGVPLSIQRGEFVAIMGASGSGKSTLMNILGCLDSPTRGKYYLEGIDVSRFSKNELADIRNNKLGFVFQNFNLLSRTTVRENIELPLVYGKKHLKEKSGVVRQLMETLGLGKHESHYPNQLSGGQQQRVAIARALVNNPTLLLADEPTGNLDSATSMDVMNVLRRLNGDMGITIVLVTHETDIARFARRTVVLKDGRILSDSQNQPSLVSDSQTPCKAGNGGG